MSKFSKNSCVLDLYVNFFIQMHPILSIDNYFKIRCFFWLFCNRIGNFINNTKLFEGSGRNLNLYTSHGYWKLYVNGLDF